MSAQPMGISVEGRVALVTGAGSGIGRGIARVLAANGARVLVVDIDGDGAEKTAKEISSTGGTASRFRGDVSSWKEMLDMARTAVERFGRIDILCQNAGIFPSARIEEMSEELWDRVLGVNLKGSFLALKACLPQMLRQRYGRVVMTASITGHMTGMEGLSHYSASKAGIVGFVRSAALELAKSNITVNAVEPGTVPTEGNLALYRESVMEQERVVPTGRLPTPEDIGTAVLFLASEAARSITGQTVVVDGGRLVLE